MTEPSPPFFVFEGLDLTLCDSLGEIENSLEGVDVADGIYEAFDAKGRVIGLKASGVRRGRFTVEVGQTYVETVAETPAGAERLARLLRDYLRAAGQPASDVAALRDLVRDCAALHRHRG